MPEMRCSKCGTPSQSTQSFDGGKSLLCDECIAQREQWHNSANECDRLTFEKQDGGDVETRVKIALSVNASKTVENMAKIGFVCVLHEHSYAGKQSWEEVADSPFVQ